jgi:hypothetical protein
MSERGEYYDRYKDEFDQDDQERAAADFEDEDEEDDKVESMIERLDRVIANEDNEDLIATLNQELTDAKPYYESASNVSEWEALWKQINEIIKLLEIDNISEAHNKWLDAELELIRLKKRSSN